MSLMTFRRTFTALVAILALGFASLAPAQVPSLPRLDFKLDKLEQALNLTPAQKEQFDVAVGATKRVLLQLALVTMQMKEKVAAELAKPRPDLGVLDEGRRAIVEEGRTLRREARDEWRKLYGMLNAEQLAAFRRFADEQFDNMGLLNELLLQLLLGRESL